MVEQSRGTLKVRAADSNAYVSATLTPRSGRPLDRVIPLDGARIPPAALPPAEKSGCTSYPSDPDIEQAMGSALKAHRDFIYQTHLHLPIVF